MGRISTNHTAIHAIRANDSNGSTDLHLRQVRNANNADGMSVSNNYEKNSGIGSARYTAMVLIWANFNGTGISIRASGNGRFNC